mmetsp:Transcript_62249/g.85975  ORF Transcript_62249/g.85975 Transcript_62249/m.85975 type:complete len:116 (+) Transcript_62249:482-829(+)
MINQSHSFYLKFFKNKGINVFLWNYRGYGRSEGKPSPNILRADADKVYDYILKTLGVKGKIGVYGRSLGGIATSGICDLVQMVIVDRTFSDLEIVAQRKFYSKFAKILYKIGNYH